jgi:hypothetical protein
MLFIGIALMLAGLCAFIVLVAFAITEGKS